MDLHAPCICLVIECLSVLYGFYIVTISAYYKFCNKYLRLPGNIMIYGICAMISFIIHSICVSIFAWDWIMNNKYLISLLEIALFLFVISQSFKYIFLVKRVQFLFIETDSMELYTISKCVLIFIWCGILLLLGTSFSILICDLLSLLSKDSSYKYEINSIISFVLNIILLILNVFISLILIYQFYRKFFMIISDHQEFDPDDSSLFASYNLNINNNNKSTSSVVASSLLGITEIANNQIPLINNEYKELSNKMSKIVVLSIISIITTSISMNGMLLLTIFDDSYPNLCFVIVSGFGIDCIINIFCIYLNFNTSLKLSCSYRLFCGICDRCCLHCCQCFVKRKLKTKNSGIVIKRPQRIRTTSTLMELQGSARQIKINYIEEEAFDSDNYERGHRTGTF